MTVILDEAFAISFNCTRYRIQVALSYNILYDKCFLSFSEEVRIAHPLFPPSPRSRLVKNIMDTKLVQYLAKYQCFSIGSLRKTAVGLYCFTESLRYDVILHILADLYLFLFRFCSQSIIRSYGNTKNDLLILYKQNDSVFCLTDKTVRRTACGSQGTY